MSVLQTEFPFTLPQGYVDQNGELHREGTMRLATAADEILPMKDPRVQQNPAYLTVILLSRVIVKLGSINVNPKIVEGLYSGDFSHLQEMYNRINQNGTNGVKAVCPKCEHGFTVEAESVGEG